MNEQADKAYSDAALTAGARAVRALYVALTAEGFTKAEALELVKALLPRTQIE